MAAVTAFTATVLALSGTTAAHADASAAPADGSVALAGSEDAISGSGAWQDDWNNEGVIATNSYANSNVAAMWQQILWADGFLNWGDIDCHFGSKTRDATVKWQRHWNVDDDGKVGRETFTKAATFLRGVQGGFRYVGVDGKYISFSRSSNGKWNMSISGDWKTVWYEKSTFDKCT